MEHVRRSDFTAAEIDDIAERAADRAIEKSWLMLGIDTSKPENIFALQSDLRYIRHMRNAASFVGLKTLAIGFAIVVGGVVLTVAHKLHIPIWGVDPIPK